MTYITKRRRDNVKNASSGITARIIDSASPNLAVNFAEGRYEHYSIRVQNRLDHLSDTIENSLRLLKESGIVQFNDQGVSGASEESKSRHPYFNEEEKGRLSQKMQELEKLSGMANGTDFPTISTLVKDLKQTGKEFAEALFAEALEDSKPKIATPIYMRIINDAQTATGEGFKLQNGQSRATYKNVNALDSLLRDVIKYKISINTATKSVRSIPRASDPGTHTLASKIREDLEKIDTEFLKSEIKDLLLVREELKMNRLVRLRLSFAVGDQFKEAGDIAERYYVRYRDNMINVLKETKNQADNVSVLEDASALESTNRAEKEKRTQTEHVKSRNEILEEETKKVEKFVSEVQEHLKFHRRLSKETIKRINAENVRLYSLYHVVAQSGSEQDKLYLKKKLGVGDNIDAAEKEMSINGQIEKIVRTAKASGQNLHINTVSLQNKQELNLLGNIFGKSGDETEMVLMLMNAINQRDVYAYFKFLDLEHVLIGEFLLKLLALKQIPQPASANASKGTDVRFADCLLIEDNQGNGSSPLS